MKLSDYEVNKLKKAYAEWALTQDSDSHAFSIDSMHTKIDNEHAKAAVLDKLYKLTEDKMNDYHKAAARGINFTYWEQKARSLNNVLKFIDKELEDSQ